MFTSRSQHIVVITMVIVALSYGSPSTGQGREDVPAAPLQASASAAFCPAGATATGKWGLWVCGPNLRGANIWQSVVIPELDGLEFKGPGPVGPPYTQADFDSLAALGANYVAISGPGLYTETPPFVVDQGVVDHLDSLLAMIAKADMFATIGFRTGPGRSEYGLCCGGDPFFDGYFNDTMWEDQEAQDAWVEMWRYTAARYQDNPIVAGYKLMVEPNSNGAFFGGIYDPEEFYSQYVDTLYDWNQLYPRIVDAIRAVDSDTPVLIGGMGWSAVEWLPYLEPVDDPRVVYVVHQYEPQDDYTHQEATGTNTYPGQLDLDYDGEPDAFRREWLDTFLASIDTFITANNAPVSVDEFGVNRWVPGGAQYIDDEMSLFEERGLNHALWEWQTSWAPFADDVHDMDFRLGPDPTNLIAVDNDLQDVITRYWSRNTIRPSSGTDNGNGDDPLDLLIDGEPYYQSRVTLANGQIIEGEMAQIFRQYLGGLGREPAAGGYQFWSERIDDGRLTFVRAAQQFIDSPEFIAKADTSNDSTISNEEFVDHMYFNVFGRAPAESGRNFWLNSIDRSSQAVAFTNMLQSPEFVRKTVLTISDWPYWDQIPPSPGPGPTTNNLRDFALPIPLFSQDSAWNQSVLGATPLPESEAVILTTYRVVRGDITDLRPVDDSSASDWPYVVINYDEWTVPIFSGGGASTDLLLCDYDGNRSWPNEKFADQEFDEIGGPVTIPGATDAVRPSAPAGTWSDGFLVLIDLDTASSYEFWQATTQSEGECQSLGGALSGPSVPEAGAVDFFALDGTGTNDTGTFSARASGVSLLAGLFVPDDLENGEIAHALALAIPGPRNLSSDPGEIAATDVIYPAAVTETDHYSVNPNALIMGQRLRLKNLIVDDEGNEIDESELLPITKLFLKALREYGAYVIENGGGFEFYAEDTYSGLLALTDAEVKFLIGQDRNAALPADKTKWQLVLEALIEEITYLPVAIGPWVDGQDPATATIDYANFEVVQNAEIP